MQHADAMSRLPLPETGCQCKEIFYFLALNDLHLTSHDVSRENGRDAVLRTVRGIIWHGWPKAVSEELKPF